MFISIIIPTLNEAKLIRRTAASLACLSEKVEIIVADGGSSDRTIEIARDCGMHVIEAPRGRGLQMNAGAKLAHGDVLLFLHADTQLPVDAMDLIEDALSCADVCGGHFSLTFDGFTSEARLMTKLYPVLRIGGMCYGDSAIFVRRDVFETVGGYREYPIFEDCDLSHRLRRQARFIRLAANATTSSRRFEGRFVRTFALWSVMQMLYWLGIHPNLLNRLYHPWR